jgi:DNA-binding NtrC family response regulator
VERELPVLVSGETGVGKENAALALHLWSPRAAHPFVVVNCAALPESLVESELFGHEKGAFSGATSAKAGYLESAAGGTLLLDEIGEVPLTVQAKLLRAVETRRIVRVGDVRERKVDVRIVAATNRALDEEVRAGRFRQDLYFRLAAAVLHLPPLRERPLELPRLARLFLDEACRAAGRPPMSLAPAAMLLLGRHSWPGNVRELKHAMDWAAASASGDELQPEHLPERIAADAVEPERATNAPPPEPPRAVPPPERSPRPLNESLKEFERARIEEALAASGGNQSRAAELLGLPLRTFVYKLKQLRKHQ